MGSQIRVKEALQLLSVNQSAIAAAVEELAIWAKQQSAVEVFQHVHDCVATLDQNSRLLTLAIEGQDLDR